MILKDLMANNIILSDPEFSTHDSEKIKCLGAPISTSALWEAATAGMEPVSCAEPLLYSDIFPWPGSVASLCLALPRQNPPRAGILPQGSSDASMARRAQWLPGPAMAILQFS